MDKKIWRFFSTFWGSVYIIFMVVNFLEGNVYEKLLGPLGTIYIASLALFVGGKEFDRWHEKHPGKRNGELFVVGFSILIFAMFFVSFFFNGIYIVPPDVVAAYIGVLSVFVISHKSKEMYLEKHESEDKKN